MRKASRRLTQLYDDALKPSGLRSTQYTILYEIERRSEQPPTMAELASALAMDRSTLGHNLRPLERDRLIALQEGDEDRRQRHAVLTSKAKLFGCGAVLAKSAGSVRRRLWRRRSRGPTRYPLGHRV
jgi:DNA-binding MarR family transcriptional regulator